MMLLAMISWLELLALIAGGWLLLKLVNGRRGEGRCGGGLKLLGLVAIVAGIGMFWIRPHRHVEVISSPPAPVTVIDTVEDIEHLIPEPVQVQQVRHVGPPRWVFISLGAGLVILGALMFGRRGNRPVAIKAVTVLGIGAILYAVVTFLNDAPRSSRHSRHERVVRFDSHEVQVATVQEDAAPPRRHSRAKRPSLRPERPTGDAKRAIEEVLPPRAGEIPVSAELARQASAVEPQEDATEKPAAEPQPALPPASEPAVAEEPKPTEEEETAQQSDSAEAEAELKAEEEASEDPPPAASQVEATAAEEAPDPPQPVEPSPAVEAATPPEPPKAAPAKPAAPQPAATEVAVETQVDDMVELSGKTRPAWVDAKPELSGQVYSISVRSGRFATAPECQRALDQAIKNEADHYINTWLDEEAAALVDIPLSYLNEHVKKAEYLEQVHSKELEGVSGGKMYELHARLEFNDQARADVRRQWRNAEVMHRLWYTGGAAALVLALLATLYGYLKLDLRTGGAHKGRLQLAATLVALIAAAGVLLVRWAAPF